MFHIYHDISTFNLDIVQEDGTVTKISIGKELQDNRLSSIFSQRDLDAVESTRILLARTSGRCIGTQCGKSSSIITRNLYNKITAVGPIGIIESKKIGCCRREVNYRGVNQCCTALSIVVIHPKHLVPTIFIYVPNVFSIIGNQCRSSGSGVIPAGRNGLCRKTFKILTPWQNGNRIALGSKVQTIAPWAHTICTTVTLHHGLILGGAAQTAECGRGFSITDGLPFTGRLQFIDGNVINIKAVCIDCSIIDSKILGIIRHVL